MAAVNFLVENLMQLLRDNAELIVGVRGEADNLLQDLSEFSAFLKQAAKLRSENQVLKELVKSIRKVVNHAEDAIDKFPPVVEVDDVVGFDEEAEKVIDRLLEGSDDLEVIPVVGMPGLGKTTLATKIFKHPKIEYEFFTRLWLYVSQSYKTRELYLNIISKLTGKTKHYHDMSEKDLADVVRDILGEGGKYLIVWDDVWPREAWDRIKIAFPKNRKRNRVLLTTRDHNVANYCNEIPHDLKLLTDVESWILLEKKAFHKAKCPPELETPGQSIARKCKGLPLAIVVIVGALIGKGKTTKEWEQVYQMSYDDLPYDLKACLLYFGAFPRGFLITAWKLIRLWIAEGSSSTKGAYPLNVKQRIT
ncbi:hypothetical protein RND71_001327 [Anisodus tanguticus]|uniref:Uncharacterized protein n=1 Tax=Anisodus tanguticus TaxID=243964 RepID=A0AAE1VYE6_9SOLA|nr:hypothetical protein RND71_001327 [Anisodus tanguticus]